MSAGVGSGVGSGTGAGTVRSGNKSIARRLASSQLWREISLLAGMDLLIAAALAVYFAMRLAAAGVDIEAGSDIASTTSPTSIASARDISHNILFDSVLAENTAAPPVGYAVGNIVGAILDVPDGTVVACEFIRREGADLRLYHPRVSFNTLWAFPADGGGYTLVKFTHDSLFLTLWHAFAGLIIVEAVIVVRDIFRFRRRTRRILRPLTELTLAARDVMAPTPAADAPLKLSGAIDTLNAITEQHLDRRIAIEDNRVELRGLVDAINGMLERLDAAYRTQLRFVSDASHELRTPISVVQGYANLLDRWGKNDEKTLQESIDAIKNEAQGMKELVEQLLFLARSDNRSITFSMEDVDVSQLCEEVARETRMIDGQHEFTCETEPGLVVDGDCQMLKQALRIFIDNSIKYTPAGGRITIRTARSAARPGYAEISVADDGIGIPEDALPHVFDRFFRADESRARSSGGTGLGLSIAKLIIDRHHGFVDVVSRKEAGTRFTMTFRCGS